MKNNILNLINSVDSILILTHVNPDGDAIGSSMAMYHALKKMNKSVDVVIPDIPPAFVFLNSNNLIKEKVDKSYDLAIVVDCPNIGRIGQLNNEFYNCKQSIVIDHHISNNMYGTINYIDDGASSCSQVIYYLFEKLKIKINKNIGECLVVGCITDTNGFSNNNVDKETFLMIAHMFDLGINIHEIYSLIFLKKSMSQFALMKMTLDRLEFFCDGKIAFSYISQEDMDNVGAAAGDYEGLVNIGKNISGVEISIFMREDNGYKISFRSNGCDVNKLANKFGGGGHEMASGACIDKPFKETKDMLIKATLEVLNN